MTRVFSRVVSIATVIFALAAPSARAFSDPPWITPPAPNSQQVVSVNIRMGICDAIVFRPGYPQVTRESNEIRILEYGDRVSFEDFCIYPTVATTESIGSFPPGNYTVKVDFLYYDYPNGHTTTTLGVIPFTASALATAEPVPALSPLWQLVLATLISGAAVFEALRRR